MIKNPKFIAWLRFTIISLLTLFLCLQNSNDSSHLTTEVCGIVQSALYAVNIQTEYTPLFYLLIRKSGHFLVFAILSANCYRAFSVSTKYHESTKKWSIVISIIIAILTEYMQLFLSGREAKVYDVIIDALGIIIGVFITSKLNKQQAKSIFNHSRKIKTA